MTTAIKTCSFCGESIPSETKRCRYCGEYLEGAAPSRFLVLRHSEPQVPAPPQEEPAPFPVRTHHRGGTFRGLHRWFAAFHASFWFLFLLGGALLAACFLLHVVSLYQERQVVVFIAAGVTLAISIMPGLAAATFSMILLYRCWDIIQDGHARTGPDRAVALLFLPFYNLYWVFVAVRGLVEDMNAYIHRHDLAARPASTRLAHAYCMLAVVCALPGLNLLMLIPLVVLHYLLMRSLAISAGGMVDFHQQEPAKKQQRFPWRTLTVPATCGTWAALVAIFVGCFWPRYPAHRATVPDTNINWLAISPDGAHVITAKAGLNFNADLTIWNSAGLPGAAISANPERRMAGNKRFANNAAYSPDGNYLVAIVQDRLYASEHTNAGELMVLDAVTGRGLFHLPGGDEEKGAVECAVFSPDSTELAAGTITAKRAGDIIIRKTTTGEELRRLTGHRRTVTCLAYSPDGKRIVSGSDDGTIRLWDAISGEKLFEFSESNGIRCVAFCPDGKCFASSDSQSVRLRDSRTGEELASFAARSRTAGITGLAFSPSGRYLAADDVDVRIWDMATRKFVLELKTRDLFKKPQNRRTNSSAIAFKSDGQRLYAARDDQLLCWDLDLPGM